MYVTAGREVSEVAREIVATITDPRAMVGPEVNFLRLTSRASLLFVRCTYTDGILQRPSLPRPHPQGGGA